jgi:hypothetical protein
VEELVQARIIVCIRALKKTGTYLGFGIPKVRNEILQASGLRGHVAGVLFYSMTRTTMRTSKNGMTKERNQKRSWCRCCFCCCCVAMRSEDCFF